HRGRPLEGQQQGHARPAARAAGSASTRQCFLTITRGAGSAGASTPVGTTVSRQSGAPGRPATAHSSIAANSRSASSAPSGPNSRTATGPGPGPGSVGTTAARPSAPASATVPLAGPSGNSSSGSEVSASVASSLQASVSVRASHRPKTSHTSTAPSGTAASRRLRGSPSSSATRPGSGSARSSGASSVTPVPSRRLLTSVLAASPRSRMNAQLRTESERSTPSLPRSSATESCLPRRASGSSSRPSGTSWYTHAGITSSLPTVSTFRSYGAPG